MRTFVQKHTQPQSSSSARSNIATPGLNHRADLILHLQRTIGNQAVRRMLQIRTEGTEVELTGRQQEAQRFAAPLIRVPAEAVPAHPKTGVERQVDNSACAEEGWKVEAALGSVSPVGIPPLVQAELRSPGEPLQRGTREYMEARFRCDFSKVRVHTGETAAESARAVHALAYTVGNHIVFGAGQYAAGSGDGARLLAHELAHVLQQRNGRS